MMFKGLLTQRQKHCRLTDNACKRQYFGKYTKHLYTKRINKVKVMRIVLLKNKKKSTALSNTMIFETGLMEVKNSVKLFL